MEQVSWLWAFGISGAAFALFFLQSALDLVRAGKATQLQLALLTSSGLLWGTLGVAMLGLLAWILARPFGCRYPLGWTLRTFALSYSPALVYSTLGLLANLVLGWNTALAFGATGVLWSLGATLATLREMLGERLLLSVIMATAFGALTLLVWAKLLSL